jgi:hypothetical protein
MGDEMGAVRMLNGGMGKEGVDVCLYLPHASYPNCNRFRKKAGREREARYSDRYGASERREARVPFDYHQACLPPWPN